MTDSSVPPEVPSLPEPPGPPADPTEAPDVNPPLPDPGPRDGTHEQDAETRAEDDFPDLNPS